MRFGSDWRNVLKNAWSVRLISVTVLLLALDLGAVVLDAWGMLADRPAVSIALRMCAAVAGVAAFVARLVAQRGLSREA